MSRLAWYVEDDNGSETNGVIVFATNEEQAKDIGASKLWSEEEYVTVKRIPEYDQYAHQKYVPLKVLHDNGWSFYCYYCEKEINSECFDYEEDVEINPVFEEKKIFCSSDCKYNHYIDIDICKKRVTQARAVLMSQYLGIYDLHVYSGGVDYDTYATFKFPGGKYKVDWNSSDGNHVYIKRSDKEAWDKFVKK